MLRSAATLYLRQSQRATGASSVSVRALASSVHDSQSTKLSYSKVPKEDFGQYSEYSVIFTNRALNLMSDPFQKVMRDLNELLKVTYNADKIAIIPGYVPCGFVLRLHLEHMDHGFPFPLILAIRFTIVVRVLLEWSLLLGSLLRTSTPS